MKPSSGEVVAMEWKRLLPSNRARKCTIRRGHYRLLGVSCKQSSSGCNYFWLAYWAVATFTLEELAVASLCRERLPFDKFPSVGFRKKKRRGGEREGRGFARSL